MTSLDDRVREGERQFARFIAEDREGCWNWIRDGVEIYLASAAALGLELIGVHSDAHLLGSLIHGVERAAPYGFVVGSVPFGVGALSHRRVSRRARSVGSGEVYFDTRVRRFTRSTAPDSDMIKVSPGLDPSGRSVSYLDDATMIMIEKGDYLASWHDVELRGPCAIQRSYGSACAEGRYDERVDLLVRVVGRQHRLIDAFKR